MVLATADAEGRPSARTVLLKGVDEGGFVLYTPSQGAHGHRDTLVLTFRRGSFQERASES